MRQFPSPRVLLGRQCQSHLQSTPPGCWVVDVLWCSHLLATQSVTKNVSAIMLYTKVHINIKTRLNEWRYYIPRWPQGTVLQGSVQWQQRLVKKVAENLQTLGRSIQQSYRLSPNDKRTAEPTRGRWISGGGGWRFCAGLPAAAAAAAVVLGAVASIDTGTEHTHTKTFCIVSSCTLL